MRDNPRLAAFKPRSPFPLRFIKGAGSEALRDAAPNRMAAWEEAGTSNERHRRVPALAGRDARACSHAAIPISP